MSTTASASEMTVMTVLLRLRPRFIHAMRGSFAP